MPSLWPRPRATLMKDGSCADQRMTSERQFLKQIEYPDPDSSRLSGRLDKYRLKVAKLLRDAQHLHCRQSTRVWKNGETVAAVRQRAEDIDVDVVRRHACPLDLSLELFRETLDGSVVPTVESPTLLARRNQKMRIGQQR